MTQSLTTRNYLLLLPASFISGIVLSLVIRSQSTFTAPNTLAQPDLSYHTKLEKLRYNNLQECIKFTGLPLRYCYDGFSSWSLHEAQTQFGKDFGDQYRECISNVGYMANNNEGITEENILSSVQHCISGLQFDKLGAPKVKEVRSRMPFGRLLTKIYDLFKFVLIMCIVTLQVYLCSASIFRKSSATDSETTKLTPLNNQGSKKTITVPQKEKKLAEIPKNRKSSTKTESQVKAKAINPEPENAVPEDNANNNSKQAPSHSVNAQAPQKSNAVVAQGKNKVIINCKEKGLIFDMTTKEGVQKWRDFVNRGKTNSSPMQEKAMVPTQVCLTPLPSQPVDFSRISLYDHNGKAFRRIFVPGLGWITRDRCIQLMQEQGFKENQVRGLDY